ncbi:MAG: polysaccharide deacetylase family protein [Dermatophilaceae bacterium]
MRIIGVAFTAAAVLAAGSTAAAAQSPPSSAATTAAVPTCQGWVALTFDDGPTPTTKALVRALERAGLKATFFNVGARVQQDVSSVKAEARVGAVENHSYSHPFLDELDPQAAANELLGTSQIITSVTRKPVTYWRAPFDRFTAQNLADAASQGLRHVSWTIDTRDWDTGASSASILGAIANVHDQDIILLHDGYGTTVDAVPQIAKLLKQKRLCSGKLANSDTPIVSAWGDQSYVKVVK